MVFTGRPFTADEMYECGFLNKVVTRDRLEAEVQTYAQACARNRPTDTVVIQKMFFQMMKQHQGGSTWEVCSPAWSSRWAAWSARTNTSSI